MVVSDTQVMTKLTLTRDESALEHHSARRGNSSNHKNQSDIVEPICHECAQGLVDQQLRHGEKHYNRRRDLPGLLHLFPAEIVKLDRVSDKAVLKRLLALTKGERLRGRSGHWRYSLTRHIGLMQALRAEKRRLFGEDNEKRQS